MIMHAIFNAAHHAYRDNLAMLNRETEVAELPSDDSAGSVERHCSHVDTAGELPFAEGRTVSYFPKPVKFFGAVKSEEAWEHLKHGKFVSRSDSHVTIADEGSVTNVEIPLEQVYCLTYFEAYGA